ncbi:MAG: endonuclease/exonuclease/phosphatase family protein [Alistipes sp.]|nr:endonuclease/exonuclease/phosphatase family protein [Candidatus Alistipes equi]
MKRIFFLFFVFSILCILPSKASSKQEKVATLRVMSYNIRHTGEKRDVEERAWENRRFATIEMFKREKPDIVGMQEVKEDQKSYLIENLPDYVPVQMLDNTKFVMYRKDVFEFVRFGNFWLSPTPNVPSKGWGSISIRATLWVELKIRSTGRHIFLFDTHLDVKSALARDNGARMCVERMRKIAKKKGVQFLVGDMNTSKQEVMDIFTSWLQDSREVAPSTNHLPTFNGWGYAKHPEMIDYIFYRNATPTEFRLLDGKDYGREYISDHYPVMCTFTVR